VLSLAVLVGVFVGLGYALGVGWAASLFVLFVLMMVFAYRRGMKLRQRMKMDPVGTMRDIDRTNTAFGKFYAGLAFVTMGIGVVAIIVVFATHA
jgi:hypothetical protein